MMQETAEQQARDARARSRSGGRTLLPLLLLLLLVTGLSSAAGADEGAERVGEPLVTQLFDVGGLVAGRVEFRGEVAPPVAPDDIGDEDAPLFGSEGEEPRYPVGQIDELIELVYGHVDPVSWEQTRGAMLAALGERHLFVKHHADMIPRVARFLAELEQRMLETVRIEVRAVRAPADRAPAEPRADEPGPSLSLTAFRGQRVSGFRGSRYAYLQTFDQEVAQSSTSVDPFVGVANLGLGVDARVRTGERNGRMTAEFDIRLARLGPTRTVGAGGGGRIDAPVFDVLACDATVNLVPQRWTPVGGHGGDDGWLLFARVTPIPCTAPASTRGILPVPRRAVGATPAPAMMAIGDLTGRVAAHRRRAFGPIPSNWTAPEPPELPDPVPPLRADQLLHLVRMSSPVEAWEDPASMEVRNDQLLVRHDAETVRELRVLLDDLRERLLWTLTTQVEVLEVPTALLASLEGGSRGAVLTDGQRAQIRADVEAGRIQRIARLDLPGRGGVRNDLRTGRDISYLQDFETKIAESAAAPVPIIWRLFSGLHLGITPELLSGGRHVFLDVRFQQSRQDPTALRRGTTPVGNIELPDMAIFRLRTGLLVPLGETVILGASGDERTSRVVLLTPTLER